MNKTNLNIVFWGTPSFAMPVLENLVQAGYKIYHFQPKSLKNKTTFDEFKKLKPDLCIVAAYGKIIPQKFLDIPKYEFLNIHPSLLPKYRGPSPIQTAILNGDQEIGVSIMVVDAEVDHGPVLASQKFSIANGHKGHRHTTIAPLALLEGYCSASHGCFQFSNHDELAKELFKLGAELLIEILPKYIAGEIKPHKQDHSQATFTKMFKRDDGRINWSESCDKIYNQIKALNPEPGTWTKWNEKVINISNVTMSDIVSSQRAGTVIKLGGKVAVATKKCYLILKSIQLECKRKTDAKSFVNGHSDFIDSILD